MYCLSHVTMKTGCALHFESKPLETFDQALDEHRVLELGLGGDGLRLAVQVLDHVARHRRHEDGHGHQSKSEHLRKWRRLRGLFGISYHIKMVYYIKLKWKLHFRKMEMC